MRALGSLVAVVVTLSACMASETPHETRFESRVTGSCDAAGADASGVVFTDDQASYALHLANTAASDTLQEVDGVGPSIADRIIAARPLAAIADLDGVAYVGARVLRGFRDHGDTQAVLDWANYATAAQLASVCRIGPKTAVAIEAARPIATIDELAEVRYIGESTLRYMLGTDGAACATKGAVLEEWCGLDNARCWCVAGDGDPGDEDPDGAFTLDEDAATGLAEETAGTFYYDNADYVWEEHCEGAYDHNLGYDQVDVQSFCDRYVSEHYFIAAIDSAMALAGTTYDSEDAAYQAVADLMEPLFFARIDGWMDGFQAALVDFLGTP